ncbi:MAG: exodeoxyribonuclease VII large subunit [Pirellulaceae bacterium]
MSRLTQRLQWTLREKFTDVWVAGEISNLTQPASGHIYLTLNDASAQLRAIVWKTTAEELSFDLENGMEVVCRGEIDIYPPRGTYQLIVRDIEPQGIGALQLALRKLHARLSAEGLFDADRKQPLPRFPRRIAVVTSPSGAAIQDFLKVIDRRWPEVEILIIPARVQGEGSAVQIAQGVMVASRMQHAPDVLVVTRGGGSAEDLWSFNDERVVRAIAACPIPVISAVGHEIDTSLSDLVADVRALTPSEAGERVVPEKQQVVNVLADLQNRLRTALQNAVSHARGRLQALESRRALTSPEDLIRVASRRVDELDLRLVHASGRQMEQQQNRLALISGRLQAISPLNVLARGYSVTETIDGTTIRQASDVATGQNIVTRLASGFIESEVVSNEEGNDERGT